MKLSDSNWPVMVFILVVYGLGFVFFVVMYFKYVIAKWKKVWTLTEELTDKVKFEKA